MNDRFDLHIITNHHSEVYCGYFRRLVLGNSLTFSNIPLCFYAKPPNFPRLFDPRVLCIRDYSDQSRTFYPSRFVRARAFTPKQKNAGCHRNTSAMIGIYVSCADYHTIMCHCPWSTETLRCYVLIIMLIM